MDVMAAKEKKEEKTEEAVVLTEAERLQVLEGNNKLNRILLIVMLVIVGFALPITLTISLLGGSGDEEASAASAKQSAALEEQVKTLKGQLSDLQIVLTTQSDQMKVMQTTIVAQASTPQYAAPAEPTEQLDGNATPAAGPDPRMIMQITKVLLGQEVDMQQVLLNQQNSMRDLANMVPGSRSWLEDYKESTNKLIANSKARSVELQRWAKNAVKPPAPPAAAAP
jgi:hypothetical protein